MRITILPGFLIAAAAIAACVPALSPDERTAIDRGRYLVKISGCNDCHTEEYMERQGEIPERDWLSGSRRGWRTADGTTYATNLRLLLNRLDEAQWLNLARSLKSRAPMSWYRLREMTDADLRAIYRFVRWLGPAGSPAPSALPAGK